MPKTGQAIHSISDFIRVQATHILTAIVVLIVGIIIIKWFCSFFKKRMAKRGVDESLAVFLYGLVRVLLYVMLFISIASMVGIPTASFIAVLGSAGLAIGLALQGSLSNFAGGILILLFKPFRIGEFISTSDASGTVQEIAVLYTTLKTPDNQMVTMPNGLLANSVVTNYSRHDTRRLKLNLRLSYTSDIKKARAIVMDIVTNDKRVLADPAPQIVVMDLAVDSVNLSVRMWTKGSDYWNAFFELQETVKEAFAENGIAMPFAQHDVHLYEHKDKS